MGALMWFLVVFGSAGIVGAAVLSELERRPARRAPTAPPVRDEVDPDPTVEIPVGASVLATLTTAPMPAHLDPRIERVRARGAAKSGAIRDQS